MAPTPPCMQRTLTSSLESFSNACFMASTVPCTSAFTMMFRSLTLPASIWLNRSSRDTLDILRICSALSLSRRSSATCRDSLSTSATFITSPAEGTSPKPSTSTGWLGPAEVTLRPLSSIIARTRPKAVPATMGSPILRVPFCTSTVATGPRPLSSSASIMVPRAALSGFALSSRTSA